MKKNGRNNKNGLKIRKEKGTKKQYNHYFKRVTF